MAACRGSVRGSAAANASASSTSSAGPAATSPRRPRDPAPRAAGWRTGPRARRSAPAALLSDMGLSELTIHPTPRSRRVHAVFTGSSSSVGHGGPGRPRNVRCCVGAGWLPPSGRGSRGLPSPRPGGDSVSGRLWAVAYLCVLVLLASGCGAAAPGRSGRDGGGPGPLPVGYQLSPAGTQHPLGDLPLASALSPDGRWLAVSNDGQGVQSLQLVSTVDGSVAQTVSYPEPNGLFVGLVFSSDGQMLFASAGGGNIIRR